MEMQIADRRLQIGFSMSAALIALAMTRSWAQQPPPPPPSPLLNYKTVTAERLKKPDDGDWLMARRTYDGWGYSPLTEITPANSARLQPVWSVATGVLNGHEAPP